MNHRVDFDIEVLTRCPGDPVASEFSRFPVVFS